MTSNYYQRCSTRVQDLDSSPTRVPFWGIWTWTCDLYGLGLDDFRIRGLGLGLGEIGLGLATMGLTYISDYYIIIPAYKS